MLKPYHIEITRLAVGEYFSPNALEKITAANFHQDRPLGLIGHDEYHFDGNAFEKSYAYVEKQRRLILSALKTNQTPSAWSAFGRLTHAVQDFYSHSNYVDLWLASHSNGRVPSPSDIDPVDLDLLNHRDLHSGRVYLPLEALYLVHFLRPLVLRILPRDSHAWMNIDSPGQGPNFPYVFEAAVQRTRIEFDRLAKDLPQQMLATFVDQ